MDLPRHERFFHFTKAETALRYILASSSLRFSRYAEMRDPLENKKWVFSGAGWEPAAGEDRTSDVYFSAHVTAGEIWSSARLLSLSIDGQAADTAEATWIGCGWASARMWEQYGDAHQGVCLVFERPALLGTIEAGLEAQGLAPPYHKEVGYPPDGGAGEFPSLDLSPIASATETVAQFVERHHEPLFFTKTSDWETEREYRLVVTDDRSSDLFVDIDGALRGVIVGEKFDASLDEDLRRLMDGRGDLGRMHWELRRPWVLGF